MSAYLLDEHLSPNIAAQLNAHNIDTQAVAARADLRTLPDADILEAATAENRILVTRNVGDFIILDSLWVSQGRQHPGILCVSTKKFPENASFIGAITTAITDWHKAATNLAGTYTFL